MCECQGNPLARVTLALGLPYLLVNRALENVADSKLQELKRSISEDQEQCLSSVVKRVEEDNAIKWERVGNEKEFKFNQSVEARFDSAISAIEK